MCWTWISSWTEHETCFQQMAQSALTGFDTCLFFLGGGGVIYKYVQVCSETKKHRYFPILKSNHQLVILSCFASFLFNGDRAACVHSELLNQCHTDQLPNTDLFSEVLWCDVRLDSSMLNTFVPLKSYWLWNHSRWLGEFAGGGGGEGAVGGPYT